MLTPQGGPAGALTSTAVNDGITTSQKATVAAFHNSDNQSPGSAGFGLLTGGVAQLLNVLGNLDRQREAGVDGISAVGISTGAASFAMQFLTSDATDNKAASAASTTAAAITLPVATIAVVSTAGFAASGSLLIGGQVVAYTAIAGNSFTGVIGGSGAIAAGTTVQQLQVFTPAAMTGNLNSGPAWSIQAGTILTLDTGGSAELVLVVAVTATTFSVVTAKAHNGTVTAFPVAGFVYNQERDAAGELDGATGSGTNVAAEYEWSGNVPANGGGFSGRNFDRARNLNAKGFGAGTLANNPLAANATSLTLSAAPTTLQAGQKILLDRAGANPETNYVALSYMPGATVVPLQIATQFSHALAATVEWDQHAPLGPQLNGFLPDGIGIEEEALWDPVSQKFYIERSATQDGVAAANVVLESIGLWNGATMDRMRTVNVFKPQNAVALLASPGSAIWTPAAGKKFRLMRLVVTSSVAGNLVFTDASGGTVIAVVSVTAAGAGVPFDLGNGYLSAAANNAIFAFNSAGAATISGTLVGTEE